MIKLLDENDVINYLIEYLEGQGYYIIDSCNTSKQGYDIVMEKDGRELYIEAKGDTSSKEKTNRYSKPFALSQKKHHVAMAIFKTLQTKTKKENCDIAIALPSDDVHKKLINSVHKQLEKLDITVFFVTNSEHVKKI